MVYVFRKVQMNVPHQVQPVEILIRVGQVLALPCQLQLLLPPRLSVVELSAVTALTIVLARFGAGATESLE